MYIRKVTISSVRSIRDFDFDLREFYRGTGNDAGWHVILGDNGSGKSTFLKCVALALVGTDEALALRENWDNWLTKGKTHGQIEVHLAYQRDVDKFSGKGATIRNYLLPVGVYLNRVGDNVRLGELDFDYDPKRYIWGTGSGWFSASYGPFRRFAGGDKDSEKLYYSNPKLAPHLSLFGENVALSESIRWLSDLQFKKLEGRAEGNLLSAIQSFVNQEGMLPHNARLVNVTSKGVEFVDGNGRNLPVESLSDGYRSILSMTFELIRQLSFTYTQEQIFDPENPTQIIAPGVVMIDEVDAHLHPSWQRRIGNWFKKHFPNLQFIVTTHSPLICQAADTVWRLPRPGHPDEGGQVTGTDLDRLRYGSVLDAYGTDLFGEDVERSEEGQQKLQRLAELNQKERHEGLTDAEKQEQQALRAAMPTAIIK